MVAARQVFFVIILILIPIEHIYGDCPFCNEDSCECKFKFRDILDKLQSRPDTDSQIVFSLNPGSIDVMSQSGTGFDVMRTSACQGQFTLKPLCSVGGISEGAFCLSQLVHSCRSVVDIADAFIDMLKKMSIQNVSGLSTSLEWCAAYTEAYSTSSQQKIYYWVNATNAENNDEWIFIVISTNIQTRKPCFSIMQFNGENLVFHQQANSDSVIGFLSMNLHNKTINKSGYFK